MSLNIKNFSYNDFKNICRTCLSNYDLKSIHDNKIIEVLRKLGVRFETNDELPQQICVNCFETINNINVFSLRCNETHSSLINCLNDFKNKQFNVKQEIEEETNEPVEIEEETNEPIEIKVEETNEPVETKEELTIEEHKFDFVSVYLENPTNLEIKQEITEITNNELYEYLIPNANDQNINHPEDNLLIPNTSSNAEVKIYKCGICNKTYKNLKLLTRHTLYSREHRLQCDVCLKQFRRADLLVIHKRLHTGERPFVCDICNKGFTGPVSLKIHKLTHNRSYNCEQCFMSFRTLKDKKRHVELHSRERPFKCAFCTKSYLYRKHLNVHQRVHTGEPQFECDVCNKTFYSSNSLHRHQRLHGSERPFKCDVCGKGFVEANKLKRHQRIHGENKANVKVKANKPPVSDNKDNRNIVNNDPNRISEWINNVHFEKHSIKNENEFIESPTCSVSESVEDIENENELITSTTTTLQKKQNNTNTKSLITNEENDLKKNQTLNKHITEPIVNVDKITNINDNISPEEDQAFRSIFTNAELLPLETQSENNNETSNSTSYSSISDSVIDKVNDKDFNIFKYINEPDEDTSCTSNTNNLATTIEAKNKTLITPLPEELEKLVVKKQQSSKNKVVRCEYCKNDIANKNFMRHLERNHENEDEVRNILQLPKNSKERRQATLLLRNSTNFDLFVNDNIVRPHYNRRKKQDENVNYFPCAYCKGMYKEQYLKRHSKSCLLLMRMKDKIS